MTDGIDYRALLEASPWYRGPIGGGEDSPAGDNPIGEAGTASAGPIPSPASTQQSVSQTSKWGSGPNPLLAEPQPQAGNAQDQSPGTAEPTPATQAQQQGASQTPVPGQAEIQQQSAQPIGPREPEYLDFGGRRVPVPVDPMQAQALRALHADWRNLNRALTQARQGIGQQGLEGQQTKAAGQQDAPPGQENRQVISSLPPQQREDLRQRLSDLGIYVEGEEAITTFSEVVASVTSPLVQSLQQELQAVRGQLEQAMQAAHWVQQQQQTEQFASELAEMQARSDLYPDLDKVLPIMDQVFELYPDIAALPNPMSVAYRLARGYMTTGQMPAPPAQQPAGPTQGAQPGQVPGSQPTSALPGANPGAVSAQTTSNPVDQLLSNQELVQQLLHHPQIRDTVIRSYLEELRSGKPPAVIGASPGGAAPAAPANTPKSIKEASSAFRAWLGQSRSQ